MHDLTYANQILSKLKNEIKEKDKKANIAVDVYLSPFSHVTPERLKDVFNLLSEKEGFANITLNANIAKFPVHCKKCGKKWESAAPTFECPECASADLEIGKWEEFHIGSVRVVR